ncbi:S9 family peptidase [Halobacteriales archaeon QH_7_65_31]|nr:MAG: S9 family peptidase [Halobacteriales archaeon QH_7_65_31]
MRDIEQYLNVRSAVAASVSADGTLAFLLDTTGTGQLWTMTDAGGWPVQRTFFEDRVTFAEFEPDGETLAFGMDEGGNERAQLYRLDPDGHVTEWTDMPEAKHRWGGWNSDGSQFAFASNRRDEAVFDVYVQNRDATGADADLVFEGDGWLSLAGWSPDDETLLLHKAHSSFDHDVYALDIDSGERTHLTPHEGSVRYTGLEWGPAGEIYLVSDEGRDRLALARLTTDGEMSYVRSDDEWNIDGVAVDEDTGRVVYSRNADGYTDLTVGDLDGGELTERDTVSFDGVAGGVCFFDGADRFAVTATSDTDNTNVRVATVGGETVRWTDASVAGLSREAFQSSELIRYETFDDREIPAYVTLPDEESPAPVIVDIHGGPESQRRPSFSAVKQYFLAQGYGYFEPNVRGSTGYGKAYTHLDDVEKRMNSVRDIRAGVEWLEATPAVDDDRLVVMGGSYGGFMCLACLTEYPELWAAGVDIVGIASFVTFLENTGEWRRELREAEYGSLAEDREFLESISPLNRADEIRAPLMVLHGANDPRVPVGEAEQIAEKASEHVPVEKLIFEDEGHGFAKRENRIEAYSGIVDFLAEHV